MRADRPDPSPAPLKRAAPTGADRLDRARGALWGLALGDALGMPSQTLEPGEIARRYGHIAGFVAPFVDHPVSHGLGPARVTDDTEQALLLARRLVHAPGAFDPKGWADDLLDWEADVRARGLRDLLGPSTKAALTAIASGADPSFAGRGGTTNGAAMRVAPVGIATAADDLDRLVDAVERPSRVTHHTGEAIAGAAAVAAAISSALDGADTDAALARGVAAARIGQSRGNAVGEGDMAARIEDALERAEDGSGPEAIARACGTSVASRESVPTALAVVRLARGDAWAAGLMAANIGDDTDTIGAMACAVCGALRGRSGLPPDALAALAAANGELGIDALAEGLLRLRDGTAA